MTETTCRLHNGHGGDCAKCVAQRKEWTDILAGSSDDELRKQTSQFIWLSAYASSNPRSAYHWMCDATYDECKKRGKEDSIYAVEHAALTKEARGR